MVCPVLKRTILCAYAILLVTGIAVARQVPSQVTISGQVKDSLGVALEAVTVTALPSGKTTLTNQTGNFSLAVPQHSPLTIRFSMQGKETRETIVRQPGQPLNITLFNKANLLDEVVVTGYESLGKNRSAGSIATLNKEAIENKGARNLDDLIQGKVAGVSVTAQSGRPGEKFKVVIRGTNTISGNTEPLWVVDGVPIQQNVPTLNAALVKSENLNEILMSGVGHIDPADIEQITILKDASAAAIYGSRAAGGVIVITTKKGAPGKVRVNYSTNVSIGLKPQRDPDLMNSQEKLAWEKELWDEFSAERYAGNDPHVPVVGIYGMLHSNKLGRNGQLWMEPGFTPYSETAKDSMLTALGTTSTDWFDQLFRNSFSNNHHLAFSGGNDRTSFYTSMGYTRQEGMVRKTGYDRYNLNSKINTQVNDRLSIGWILNLSQQRSRSYSMSMDPFRYAYFANPYEAPYNEDGSYRYDQTYMNLAKVNDGYENIRIMEPAFGYNILHEIDNTSSDAISSNMSGTMDLQYKISRKLRFSGLASYTYVNDRTEDIKDKTTYTAFQDRLFFDDFLSNRAWTPYGSITQSTSQAGSYNLRGHFVYSDMFNAQHGLRVWAGAEIRGNDTKRFFTKRYGYDPNTTSASFPVNPVPATGDHSEYAALINSLSGQGIVESRYASFYSSLDYSFRNRYVLNASLRTDGSNNFGSNKQFNPTWSIGAAWHMDEEAFMQDLKPVLNKLSLRVATGFTGNVVSGVKKQLVLSYGSATWNNLQTGSISTAPNPDLRWEKTRDYKASLEFGLFRDRISGLVETYLRQSSDLITYSSIPSTTGFLVQNFNTSTIENRGLEATLKIDIVRQRNLNISLSGNVAWNENKLKAYYSPNGGIGDTDAGIYVGYPTSSLFGGQYNGVDPWTGYYSFVLRPDASLITSGDLNKTENYLHYLGTPQADVTGGANLRVAYKAFSINLGGAFFFGANILNQVSSPAGYAGLGFRSGTNREKPQTPYSDLYRNHLNASRDATDRWTPEKTTGVSYPRIVDYAGERLYLDTYTPQAANIVNGALREEVSFFRLRDITLSYNLPVGILRGIGMQSLSFAGTFSNFFTFTNYKGIDPETPGTTYPITRSVFFRLQAGF
ncbi:MAG: SusC/RagA family TonB-linked outer membrane protein [Candidatus Pseudobacter hemicellulosilyticus]|uniref:SusC/RagA family TonB-linked outer membrane protein n=1 Tax=Candidatus Pseudobacter hemicellulosilyticus TaxID=3121375 RepID=A0AAJ5WQB0_9BACT|nr:MAG: SusC/RagA family TonB-linked outer membrane protein [Pseudobacter sp.]